MTDATSEKLINLMMWAIQATLVGFSVWAFGSPGDVAMAVCAAYMYLAGCIVSHIEWARVRSKQ